MKQQRAAGLAAIGIEAMAVASVAVVGANPVAPAPPQRRPTNFAPTGHHAQQAIERMDQCIARRAALEPGLRRWLATLPARGAR